MRPSRRLERWCLDRLRHGPTISEPPGLDRLTVVVPSFGRPEFVLRQLVYWSGTTSHLLILDGSPNPIPESVQELVEARTEFSYLHWPVGLDERFHRARDLITTEYTVLGGDDEFLLRRGLAEAVGVLDRDQTHVACMGQSLAFVPSPDGRHLEFGPGYPHRGFVNADPDVRQRVLYAMSRYNAITCYAVTRTETWRLTWGEALDWSSVYAMEVQHAISSWLSGGLITVDEIYWLRSGENPSVRDMNEQRLTFTDWWTDPIYASEVSRFQGLLADHAVAVGAADSNSAPRIVSEAIEVFTAFREAHRKAKESKGVVPAPTRNLFRHHRIGKVAWHVVNHHTPSVGICLRRIWRQVRRLRRRGRDTSPVHIDSLVDDGLLPTDSLTEEFYAEMKGVEQIVLDFYRVR